MQPIYQSSHPGRHQSDVQPAAAVKLDLTSCTFTMPAGEPINELHDRQPAILACDAYDPWLDPAKPLSEVKPLLQNNLDGDLEFRRVNRKLSASGRSDRPGEDASMIGPPNPL